jgi:predicted cupin superfamily sugar epimerase
VIGDLAVTLAQTDAGTACRTHSCRLIPGGTWHMSRVRAGGSYALLGTTEWPGFGPSDLEIADVAALMRAYPDFRAEIAAVTAAGDTASQTSFSGGRLHLFL